MLRYLCLAEMAGMMVAPCPPWKSAVQALDGGDGECYLDRWQLLIMAANHAMRT